MVKTDWGEIVNSYIKPDVIPTAHSERPSGAVDTVDHFSKPLIIRKYIKPTGFDINDGLNKKGDYVTEVLWCVLKPVSISKNGLTTTNNINGKDITSEWWLYYNPYHKEHGKGQHLQIASKSNNTGYSGFADEVEYQNELYTVTSIMKIDAFDFDDTEDNEGNEKYIGKCKILRVGNTNHIEETDCTTTTKSHYELK